MIHKPTVRISAILLSIVLFSCGSPKSNENKEVEIEHKELPAEERAERALYDEVMKVHDEAMPKMDNMMKLKGKLQEQLDLLREQESDESTEVLEEAIKNLEEADEAMMQWMRDFEPMDNDSVAHEKVLKYYEKQKFEIEEVHQKMQAAIAKAKELSKK